MSYRHRITMSTSDCDTDQDKGQNHDQNQNHDHQEDEIEVVQEEIISFDEHNSHGEEGQDDGDGDGEEAVEVIASHSQSESSSVSVSVSVSSTSNYGNVTSKPHTNAFSTPSQSRSRSRPSSSRSARSYSSRSSRSSLNTSISGNGNGNGTEIATAHSPSTSARKALTDFIATEPSNRSCADCNCLLIDFTKMYASFCITTRKVDDNDDGGNGNGNDEDGTTTRRDNMMEDSSSRHQKSNHLNMSNFKNCHMAFAPPSSPTAADAVNGNANGNGNNGAQGSSSLSSPSHPHPKPCTYTQTQTIPPTPWIRRRKKRRLGDNPHDEIKAIRSIPHGVFLCQSCAVAHRVMAQDFHERSLHTLARKYGNDVRGMGYESIIVVKSVTLDQWSRGEVEIMLHAGGNAYSKHVLERYYNELGMENDNDDHDRDNHHHHQSSQGMQQMLKRPNGDSSDETRELFIRAKYQALAFALPNGPASSLKWGMSRNQIMGHGGVNVGEGIGDGGGGKPETPRALAAMEPLPNRLVDYFCIVSSNGKIEGSSNDRYDEDLSTLRSPDELRFETEVTECFPKPQSHAGAGSTTSTGPPGHLTKFVFPDGCKPHKSQMPTLFTFTLTNENGTKLYGAAMHIYDTYLDLQKIRECIHNSGYDGDLPPWLGVGSGSGFGTDARKKRNGHIIAGMDSVASVNSNGTLHSTRSSSSGGGGGASSVNKAAAVTGQEHDIFFLPKCLVILSHYGFYDAWRKFLLQIYHISIVQAPLPLERYIANFVCEVPLPPVGRISVKVTLADDQSISISRPPVNRLPLVDCSYRPLFACLSASNIMVVVGCLLQETRVALCSKHCALLTPCCEALVSFLFPFVWQGIYIPIVPTSMIVDLLEAPVPFLVGMSAAYLSEVSIRNRPKGVVLVDLDEDEVHLGFEESTESHGRLPPFLPERDASKLKASLEKFGGCEYIVPASERKGRITYCGQYALPNEQRSTYCRSSYVESSSEIGTSRSERLAEVDRAFLDDEHLMPIDFSAGTLTGSSDISDTDWKVKGMKKKVKARGKGKKKTLTTETISQASSHLLDIDSPHETFDSNEIRNAFLRFLVALFQDYEKFIEYATDERREFLKEKFIWQAEARSFVSEIVASQMFDTFIEEKLLSPDENPNIRFFDDSIVAKRNRSKATVGRKRETTFLNDNSGRIVETFIPPAPNNHDITESSFRYNSFPQKLSHSLFGKIRPPKKLQDVRTQKRTSLTKRNGNGARSSTLSSTVMQQKIMSQLLKNYSGTSMRHLEKDINWALHAIVYRNARNVMEAQRPGDDAKKEGFVINRGGDHFVAPDLLEKAWDILFHTRSQQLLYIVDVIIIQRQWLLRGASRKLGQHAGSYSTGQNRHNWMRAPAMKNSWRRLKSSVSMVQAHCRRRQVRSLFQSVKLYASKIQALMRGCIVRKRVYTELNLRIEGYREQIVMLWDRAYTPLFYRSRFWILDNLSLFLSHALHEEELVGLYSILGIQIALPRESAGRMLVESAIHETFLQTKSKLDNSGPDRAIFPAEIDSRSTLALNLLFASEQVSLERVQIYERLQDFPRKKDILNMMKITDSKMKKVNVASSLWSSNIDKNVSATIIHSLFPELSTSANIMAKVPSRKGLVRFSLPGSMGNPLPKPLDRAMHIESKIDNLVLKNMTTVTKSIFTFPPQNKSPRQPQPASPSSNKNQSLRLYPHEKVRRFVQTGLPT